MNKSATVQGAHEPTSWVINKGCVWVMAVSMVWRGDAKRDKLCCLWGVLCDWRAERRDGFAETGLWVSEWLCVVDVMGGCSGAFLFEEIWTGCCCLSCRALARAVVF